MRFLKSLRLPLVGGLACAALLSHPLSAQTSTQSWPQRPVRVIVPLPAGTAIDASARLFGDELSHRWKQPVIVENIPGADGILATKEFVRRTDGHTLLYSFAGLITINPLLYKILPYDPAHDLVPIAITSDNFLAIAASKKSKIGSLGDLVKLAKSQPGKLNWAATAGIPYFALAGFQKGAQIDIAYVPYRDFTPAVTDLDEGRIDIASTALTQLLPHEQAGHARLSPFVYSTFAPENLTAFGEQRLYEAEELAELARLRTSRAEAVDLMVAVAIADGHAAIQHLLGRDAEARPHDFMHAYPQDLWTRIEPVPACQES